MRFISSSEGGDEGGRKVFIQFLHCCCSTAATRSVSKCSAKSLWRSSSLCFVSFSSCFFRAFSSSLFCSAVFASLQTWCKEAKLQAGIKPTALCSAIDKENSIESSLDFLYYLYNYYMVCALFSHAYYVTYHVTSCDVTVTVTLVT